MSGYKSQVTLNERDSLQDMLNLEKNLVKVYALAMTEGCSKGFRNLVNQLWQETVDDQMQVFMLMTEHDYARVTSAPEEQLCAVKKEFSDIKSQLS